MTLVCVQIRKIITVNLRNIRQRKQQKQASTKKRKAVHNPDAASSTSCKVAKIGTHTQISVNAAIQRASQFANPPSQSSFDIVQMLVRDMQPLATVE